MRVELAGRTFVLDPEGAVVHPASGTAFVADLHLGKGTLFRRRGLALPEGDEARDLERLDGLVARHGVERLVILGDLVHAAGGVVDDVVARFADWRGGRSGLRVTLVRGNHDRGAGRLPRAWDLDVVEAPLEGAGWTAHHEPPVVGDSDPERAPWRLEPPPALAGHLHPVLRLRGVGGGGLRPRCFWWSRGVLIVPAFGSFTGGLPVRPRSGDRLFVIPPTDAHGPRLVVEIPTARLQP